MYSVTQGWLLGTENYGTQVIRLTVTQMYSVTQYWFLGAECLQHKLVLHLGWHHHPKHLLLLALQHHIGVHLLHQQLLKVHELGQSVLVIVSPLTHLSSPILRARTTSTLPLLSYLRAMTKLIATS